MSQHATLRAYLTNIGLTTADYARTLAVSKLVARRWTNGERDAPPQILTNALLLTRITNDTLDALIEYTNTHKHVAIAMYENDADMPDSDATILGHNWWNMLASNLHKYADQPPMLALMPWDADDTVGYALIQPTILDGMGLDNIIELMRDREPDMDAKTVAVEKFSKAFLTMRAEN